MLTSLMSRNKVFYCSKTYWSSLLNNLMPSLITNLKNRYYTGFNHLSICSYYNVLQTNIHSIDM